MAHLDADDWDALDKRKFLLYGGAFTIAVDFALYPLELVKTRVQVEAKVSSRICPGRCTQHAKLFVPKWPYVDTILELMHGRMQSQATVLEGTIRGFRGVLASEGPRGLWRGFPLFTLGGLPSQGAYFGGYNWAHHVLTERNERLPAASRAPLVVQDALAGFFADAVAAPLWTPTEVVSTRMQIQGPGVVQYESTTHAFRHIVATEGVRGLFRGLGASILAFGPASALWWSLYQSTHRSLTESRLEAQRHTEAAGTDSPIENVVWIDAVSGLVAGCLTSIVTNPLDIAKTRLQTQHALLSEYELVAKPAKSVSTTWGKKAVFGQHPHPLPAEHEYSRRASLSRFLSKAQKDKAARMLASEGPQTSLQATFGAQRTQAEPVPAPAQTPSSPATPAPVAKPEAVRIGRACRRVPPILPTLNPSTSGHVVVRLTARSAASAAAHVVASSSHRLAQSVQAEALRKSVAATARATVNPAFVHAVSAPGAVGGALLGKPFNSALAPWLTSNTLEEAVRKTVTDLTAGGKLLLLDKDLDHPALKGQSLGSRLGNGSTPRPVLHKGMIGVLRHILRTDGPGALIRGLAPRMLMQGPASAATFVAYEQVKRLSRKEERDEEERD